MVLLQRWNSDHDEDEEDYHDQILGIDAAAAACVQIFSVSLVSLLASAPMMPRLTEHA